MSHIDHMKAAIGVAEKSIISGNEPFAVIVVDNKTGEIICEEHDRVREYNDPTAHAEINAIRLLCKKYKKLKLEDTTFYTTSEPCAVCLSAIIRVKVSCLVYGADTEKNASLPIPSHELIKHSKHFMKIIPNIEQGSALAQRDKFYQDKK